MTQQPEALRWAYLLEREANEHGATDYKHKAAAELRRLDAENEKLKAAVEDWQRRFMAQMNSISSTGIDSDGYRRW